MLFLWLTEVHKIKVVQFLIRLITAVINLVKSVTELQINIFENYVNKFLKVPWIKWKPNYSKEQGFINSTY